MTDIPFVYGKIASGENFTDRTEETAKFTVYFQNLVNSIIISPRRFGKSSLVSKVGRIATEQDKDLRVCYIDLFNVRNEEEFYSLYAQKVIACASSHLEDAVRNTKEFIRQIVPNISIGDQLDELRFHFSWNEILRSEDEILDLPDNIGKAKNLKIMVCIDEFQNISSFNDPLAFQKKLRAHWQQHQNAGYCFYGSKRHMMMELFDKGSKPFYKFGDIVFLPKIDSAYMKDFIMKRFSDTGKEIDREAADMIIELTDNHPYYIQQLSQLSWIRTSGKCSTDIVKEAHSELLIQSDLIFKTIAGTMSSQQLCFLNAILDGEKTMSNKVMNRYGITSTTSATRAKRYLISEDIIDGNTLEMLDPIFRFWLKNVYFTR